VSRRHALVVTPRLPLPLDDGGRIGLWQAVRSVAQEYRTTLVSLVSPAHASRPPAPEFAAIGVSLVAVPHRPPWTPVAAVRGALGRWPYMLARYRNRALDATLRRIVAEDTPAFAYVHHLHMATYLDALMGTPVVLREHNLDHLWLDRFARSQRNPFVRAYALHQVQRMKDAEVELCSRCRLVLAIREEEAEALRRTVPRARVEVVPIGIEMDRYLPRAPEQQPIVLLAGSWDWPPNPDGGRRFIDRGWPRVRARVPQARLRVVGKAMPESLTEAARDAGAEPVGYVESMAPEFARAAVLVVPLWIGAGARVKIVEAMAARLPVVTTTLGAEGLGLEPGRHAAFADTPEALGDAIADLLQEPGQAGAMAEAAYGFAREHFALDVVSRRTLDLCASVIAEHEGTVR